MPGLFITATGTDVGKTYVTAALIRAGRRAGLVLDALKPVLTGYDEAGAATSDAGVLLRALGREVTQASVARLAPWRFKAPLSPDMAAAAEGRLVDVAAVAAFCRVASRPDRLTLIEGIGGVMVPLDDRYTVLDLIAVLALPVVLVSGTYLGALSHCLSAFTVLRDRGHPPCLIILDESVGSTVPVAATRDTLARFCDDIPIAIVSRDAGDEIFDQILQQILMIPGNGALM